jgi:hypothetical protein
VCPKSGEHPVNLQIIIKIRVTGYAKGLAVYELRYGSLQVLLE